MAIVSAVPALVAYVAKYFETMGIDAEVAFGRNQLARQPSGKSGRVVFAPDPEGRAGKLTRAVRLKANAIGEAGPRPILHWEKYFVVQIWAIDHSDQENEQLQFVAFENLLEATGNALLGFGHADQELGDPLWTQPNVERFYGYAALVPLQLRGPLFAPEPVTRTPTLATPLTREFVPQT